MQLSAIFLTASLLSAAAAQGAKYWLVATNASEPRVNTKIFGTTPDSHVALDVSQESRFRVQIEYPTVRVESPRNVEIYLAVNSDKSISQVHHKVTDIHYVSDDTSYNDWLVYNGAKKFYVCLDNSFLYVEEPASCRESVNVAVSLVSYFAPTPISTGIFPAAVSGYGNEAYGPIYG